MTQTNGNDDGAWASDNLRKIFTVFDNIIFILFMDNMFEKKIIYHSDHP